VLLGVIGYVFGALVAFICRMGRPQVNFFFFLYESLTIFYVLYLALLCLLFLIGTVELILIFRDDNSALYPRAGRSAPYQGAN